MLKSRPLEGLVFTEWEIHEVVLENGRTPVMEFLDGLDSREQDAFLARLQMLVEGPPFQPLNTFKTFDGLWQISTHNHRLLGFKHGKVLLLLTNGFKKTRQQTPTAELARSKALKATFEEQASRKKGGRKE